MCKWSQHGQVDYLFHPRALTNRTVVPAILAGLLLLLETNDADEFHRLGDARWRRSDIWLTGESWTDDGRAQYAFRRCLGAAMMVLCRESSTQRQIDLVLNRIGKRWEELKGRYPQ